MSLTFSPFLQQSMQKTNDIRNGKRMTETYVHVCGAIVDNQRGIWMSFKVIIFRIDKWSVDSRTLIITKYAEWLEKERICEFWRTTICYLVLNGRIKGNTLRNNSGRAKLGWIASCLSSTSKRSISIWIRSTIYHGTLTAKDSKMTHLSGQKAICRRNYDWD